MEDFKTLVEIVKGLPSLTVWILAAYFFYKIFIVGSFYGIIRLCIFKGHDLLKNRTITRVVKIGDYVLTEESQRIVLDQIGRIADKQGTFYIKEARFLKLAVDAAIQKRESEQKESR